VGNPVDGASRHAAFRLVTLISGMVVVLQCGGVFDNPRQGRPPRQRVLAPPASTPRFAAASALQLSLRRPLFAGGHLHRARSLAVWREGGRISSVTEKPKMSFPDSMIFDLSKLGDRREGVGGVLALCRDSPADPPPHHPGPLGRSVETEALNSPRSGHPRSPSQLSFAPHALDFSFSLGGFSTERAGSRDTRGNMSC
jgi:hypothetical protein